MTKSSVIIFCLSLILGLQLNAQESLSKAEAIRVVLENNFNLRIEKNNIAIAENNTSIYNSGYLPTLTGSAGVNFNTDNLNVEFQDGSERTLDGATSNSRNAGLSLNYLLFDGFNRKYNMERNIENLNVAQLTAKATLETVLATLFTAYYDVARNELTLSSLKETLEISKDRLVRSEFGFEYGRNTRLDISNSEVDVNTDSINYLNTQQALGDAQRNLNLILGRKSIEPINVDTTLSFTPSILDETAFRAAAATQNTTLLIAQSGVSISELDTKINSSRYLPTVSLNGGYNARLGNNNSASFTASNSSTGLTGGLTLGWNIFDGGSTRTIIQNSKINQSTRKILMEETIQQVSILFENAWSDYRNKLFIVTAQENNLNSNKLNFERTAEQYKIGKATSIDFRTSQNNLLLAKINLINARFEAKISELVIFQLAGKIQEATF